MDATRLEAMDLLKGWRDEKRFLGCLLVVNLPNGLAKTSVTGWIHSVTDVLLSCRVVLLNPNDGLPTGLTEPSEALYVEVPLHNARFEYGEPEGEAADVVESQLKVHIANGVTLSLVLIHSALELPRDNGGPSA